MTDTEDKIMDAAQAASDPKDRAYLFLLREVNANLKANTALTQVISKQVAQHMDDFLEHRKEFEAHVEEERDLLNQGKGAWRSAVVAMAILQAIFIFLGGWYIRVMVNQSDAIQVMHDFDIKSELKHERHSIRLDKLERKVFP